MPAILKRATQKELSTPPLPDENNPDPLFITFECGFVPTGVFCGLITHLVSIGTNKIFGMEWKLKQDGVKQNHISFFVHNVNEVTFLSHDKCFEIRLIYREDKKGLELHELCTHVISAIFYVFGSQYQNLSPVIAFQCQCQERNPLEKASHQHLCILKRTTICVQYLCENHRGTLNSKQQVWIGKYVSLGCEVTLDVLKYAGDEKKDFSFHWMKDKEMNIKTKSSLLFNKVKKEHFCHYQCQVKKEGKVVFTTYRALFERAADSQAHTGREQSALSSRMEELCKKYDLTDDDIDIEVSDEHIKEIYSELKNWRRLAVHLGLTQPEIEAIEQKAKQDPILMRLYMLQEWKNKGKLDEKATYQGLLKALLECRCPDSAILVCKLLSSTW